MKKFLLILGLISLLFYLESADQIQAVCIHCADATCNAIYPSESCKATCGYEGSVYCAVQYYCEATTGCYENGRYSTNHECTRHTNCWTGCCTVCATNCGSCNASCESWGTQTCSNSCGGTMNISCYNSTPCCSPVNGGWSAWSSCQSNCTQTRTCTNPSPYCGGSGCTGPSSQVCGGDACRADIVGTLFDASDMTSCPGDIATNPAYSSLRFGGAIFDVNSTTPTNQTVTTGADGTYIATVAPDVLPKTYSFDFTTFLNSGRVTEMKLQCQGLTATTITGETVTKDTGFWRQYGGWWQVIGGNVYAGLGIGSSIPGSVLPTTNQKLILADTGGRDGTLSYGLLLANQLGTNPNAEVSESLREVLSFYGGLRYDYNFYKTRMDIFASTIWDGGEITYNDAGKGYQIFKYAGNIDLNYGGPTGDEKVILLVDGSVNVNQDIIVPPGAFLAIITNGNITFSDNVANAQGWYLAENINIPCHDGDSDGECDKDDVQFVGQGSFVGWTGIYMTRDRAALNNQAPSEKFIYRSDLLMNAPDPMRVYTRKFSPFVP